MRVSKPIWLLCTVFVITLGLGCNKEEFDITDLVPEGYEESITYLQNGGERTSRILLGRNSNNLGDCYMDIIICDFALEQPLNCFNISRIESCASLGDTMMVIGSGGILTTNPGLPYTRFSIYGSGDEPPRFSYSLQDSVLSNYIVVHHYDEATREFRADFDVTVDLLLGNAEEVPPAIRFQGSVDMLVRE